jgi:hypothetical protein
MFKKERRAYTYGEIQAREERRDRLARNLFIGSIAVLVGLVIVMGIVGAW